MKCKHTGREIVSPLATPSAPASKSQREWSGICCALTLRPRHRWFSASDKRAEDGWSGPHATIEEALLEQLSDGHQIDLPVYVAQGYKRRKWEREEYGGDWAWEVDAINAIEVRVPNPKCTGPEGNDAP